MDTVNIKINGVEYTVPANATVLEAARYAKDYIGGLVDQGVIE